MMSNSLGIPVITVNDPKVKDKPAKRCLDWVQSLVISPVQHSGRLQVDIFQHWVGLSLPLVEPS